MLLIRSLLFNLFLYTGIVLVFLIAIPTLLMPPKFALFFGKFLGHYVVFIVRFFLSTKVEFKGTENIPNTKKYFVNSFRRENSNKSFSRRIKKKICKTKYLSIYGHMFTI